MKEIKNINEVIVVEGKSDTEKLKTFFNVETIETHGLGLNKETIELIRKIHSKRGVIVFTDPDAPGEKIRAKLNEAIPGLKNAFVLKENARTTKKVGIEHADYETLKEALEHVVTYTDKPESLSLEEFYDLGLNGQEESGERRKKITEVFHIGKCNAKTMFHRLNMLGITADEIRKELD